MAKISLRAYNKEIEGLIDSGRIDEAIAHCRHILSIFPKHVDTYRLLGKAFLESQRYGDASDILQRVLSSAPDDFVSHVGMSIIREDEGNLDEAIWHMERAFEIQPANNAIQGELRRLYGRRDGMEPPKVRLTRGALARMYAKGDLYQQAIAEMRAALAEDSQRLDLQVLLARVYAQAGMRAEAAETANTVLQKLPYCLEANRVLAEVLATSDRAEEAQGYQIRVQALDPYSAHISPGASNPEQAPDQAVVVEKLEWKAGSMPGGAGEEASQPEWAASLGVSLEGTGEKKETLPDWMESAGWSPSNGAAEEEQPVSTFDEGGDEEDSAELANAEIPDWLRSMAPDETDEPETAEPEMTTFDDIFPPEPEAPTPSAEALPTEEDETPEEMKLDLPDWLTTQEPATSPMIASAAAADWLNKPGDEIPEAEEEPVSAPTDFPEWLLDEKAQPEAEPAPEIPDWLKSMEEEPVSQADAQAATEPEEAGEATAMPEASAASEIPEWLREFSPEEPAMTEDAGVGLASVAALEETAEAAETLAPAEAAALEIAAHEPAEVEAAAPVEEAQGAASFEMNEDAAFAWLESLAVKQGASEALLLTPEERLETPPEWVQEASLEHPGVEEAVAAEPYTAEEILAVDEQTAAPATEEMPVIEPTSEIPDWLRSVEQGVPLESETAAAEAEMQASDEIPDWLRSLEATAPSGLEPAEASIEAEAEAVPGELPDWLLESAPDAETVEDAELLAAATSVVAEGDRLETPLEWVREAAPSSEEAGRVAIETVEETGAQMEAEAAAQPEATLESEALPDFTAEAKLADQVAATPASDEELPPWLQSAGELPTIEAESAGEIATEPGEFDITATNEPELPDWLQAADGAAPEEAETPTWMAEGQEPEPPIDSEAPTLAAWAKDLDEGSPILGDTKPVRLRPAPETVPDEGPSSELETPTPEAPTLMHVPIELPAVEGITPEAVPAEDLALGDSSEEGPVAEAPAWMHIPSDEGAEPAEAAAKTIETEMLFAPVVTAERAEAEAPAQETAPESALPDWAVEPAGEVQEAAGAAPFEMETPLAAEAASADMATVEAHAEAEAMPSAAWLERIEEVTAVEAAETEAPSVEEQPESTTQEWAEELSMEQPEPELPESELIEPQAAQAEAGAAVVDMEDTDAAFAWLESLAVKQGADEALLLKPEDRLEAPPAWVEEAARSQPEADLAPEEPSSEAESPVMEEAAPPEAVEEEPAAEEAVELPDWLKELSEEQAEASQMEAFTPPFAESTEEAPVEEEAPAEAAVTNPFEAEPEPVEEMPALPSWLAEPAPGQAEEEEEWAPPVESQRVPETPTQKIDLNQASLGELERLPGVGFILAQRILTHRENYGSFTRSDDLLQVPGFSPSMLQEIQDQIYVEAPEAPAPPPAMQEETRPELVEARTALIEGDLNRAIDEYTALIKSRRFLPEVIQDLHDAAYRYPLDVTVWQTLGDAYLRDDQLQRALDAYTKAEDLLR